MNWLDVLLHSLSPLDTRESLEQPALHANCTDCGDTGRRAKNADGADVIVHCWCGAGDE